MRFVGDWKPESQNVMKQPAVPAVLDLCLLGLKKATHVPEPRHLPEETGWSERL